MEMDMEMVMMMAKCAPREFLAEHLKESLDEFILVPTEETWGAVFASSMMICLKGTIEEEDIRDVLNQLREQRSMMDVVKRMHGKTN